MDHGLLEWLTGRMEVGIWRWITEGEDLQDKIRVPSGHLTALSWPQHFQLFFSSSYCLESPSMETAVPPAHMAGTCLLSSK